ncbi:MAG: hypothetical protein IJ060_03950 [Oscillospiraceae bacterium]|nr:hypothetical protein [Oscillospiraceae bacterium]
MNKTRCGALLVTGALIAASAATVLQISAATASDVRHLFGTLTVSEDPVKADDFNGDAKINSVDLTLMKRDLLTDEPGGPAAESVIPATETTVKLIGRTLLKDQAEWLVQSGSAVECTVTGTAASVTIVGDGCVYSDEKYRPRYAVYVDDELLTDVVMSEPKQTVPLFQGTAQRTAKVRVIHLSEANNGAIGVQDFTVTSSAKQPVKPTAKKDLTIEFIGDSITCAYGVEADSQYVSFETGTENFTMSYAYLTAEMLDADYSAVSYSGHGIISGYSNDGAVNTESLVPPVYEFVGKPADYQTEWDFAANPNDVVVVNLGTNDDSYATKDLETRGKEYQEGYVSFLKQIRAKNPDAAIVCTLGIMGCEELYPYIEAAVAEVNDPKITCYQSPTQKSADGYGADWHPSPKTHQLNAYLLADKICDAIGRESSKIGIDLAMDGEYGTRMTGGNMWPYYAEWNKSMNLNITAGGSSKEDIQFYITNLNLPAGSYELSFDVKGAESVEIPYEIHNIADPSVVYCSDSVTGTHGSTAFTMTKADTACEIVFYLGSIGSGNITFENVTLYKTA